MHFVKKSIDILLRIYHPQRYLTCPTPPTMPIVCKNCGNEFEGAYCNRCGQSADTTELNLHFLRDTVIHELLPFDKGILFTLRELFIRPGHAIREYIDGKRVRHIKPLSLVLVLAGIFGFLFHYFHISILSGAVEVTSSGPDSRNVMAYLDEVNNWIAENYALVCLVQLPLYALGTFLMFRKKGYNYVSHFVLNAYLTGQRLFLRIVFFPLYYLSNQSGSAKVLSSFINLAGFALTVWTLSQFFDKERKINVFWRTLGSYVIFYTVFLTLTGGLSVLLYYYFVKGHL